MIRIPPRVLFSLRWWVSPVLSRDRYFREPQLLVLMTDASLYSWEAHLGSHFAQGRWSEADLVNGINWLALWAIHLALQAFQDKVQGHHILVRTDNVAAKAHVNRLGGTHS